MTIYGARDIFYSVTTSICHSHKDNGNDNNNICSKLKLNRKDLATIKHHLLVALAHVLQLHHCCLWPQNVVYGAMSAVLCKPIDKRQQSITSKNGLLLIYHMTGTNKCEGIL